MPITSKRSKQKWFTGTMITWKLTGEESNNAVVVADLEAVAGSEPPRHLHTREDEVFIIHEGSMSFFVGDDIWEANPGDTVFLPRNIPHHYTIHSDSVKCTLIATPGFIDGFYNALSVPGDDDFSGELQTPSEAQIQYFLTLTEQYGMRFI
ncbi:cupin domain-containing protein [Flavihumibacter petaseus]|uniref:Cupin type-2 domain-containing protein n=1 Tax=Flavihumibacter petaseus NBRC 106054 TaxID=1220578 RepID=A0A0E9MXN3_9BACT|nr:cupin domain-containing protein [Flavihumibacter petaseus]GAO41870.1 hypothetical protein FPE01S_01_08850 [Flavihumibacter petaseus NBRC 106054]